jgi:outer membrane protein OmpA-like peptidoglycan-associated protein
VTGVSFKTCPRSALETTFWIDEVWFGSCGPEPLPGGTGEETPIRAGAPAPALAVEVSFRYTLPSDLAFDSGKAEFKPQGARELLKWAKVVRNKYPGSGLVLTGHTDATPLSKELKFKDNAELSLARALAVRAYLVQDAGYEEGEIEVAGRGQDEPLESNATAEGRAKNRRVEVLVTGKARQQIEEVAAEGDRLLAMGLFKEAWERYLKIAEVAYQDPQVWYRLAVTADRAGDRAKSEEALKRMRMLLGK